MKGSRGLFSQVDSTLHCSKWLSLNFITQLVLKLLLEPQTVGQTLVTEEVIGATGTVIEKIKIYIQFGWKRRDLVARSHVGS